MLFTYAAVIFVAWSAATVASCSLPPMLALLLGATLTLPPHPYGEIFANTTNAQWLLAPTLAVIVATSVPAGRLAHYNQMGFAVCSGLSGPFSIFLAPVAFYRLWRGRDIVTVLTLGASCIQLATLIATLPPIADLSPHGSWHLFATMLLRIDWSGWVGLLTAMAITVASILIKKQRLPRIGLLILAAAIFWTTFIKFLNMGWATAFDVPENGARYFYLPQLVLLWCALSLCFSGAIGAFVGAIWLAVASLFYPHAFFKKAPLIDQHWNRFAPEIGKRTVIIPINPNGWSITVPAR